MPAHIPALVARARSSASTYALEYLRKATAHPCSTIHVPISVEPTRHRATSRPFRSFPASVHSTGCPPRSIINASVALTPQGIGLLAQFAGLLGFGSVNAIKPNGDASNVHGVAIDHSGDARQCRVRLMLNWFLPDFRRGRLRRLRNRPPFKALDNEQRRRQPGYDGQCSDPRMNARQRHVLDPLPLG